jgi:cytochrome c oxidase subunit 2
MGKLNQSLILRTLGLLTLVALAALLFTGCDADTPQNTFDPNGEVASKQRDIFLLAMWPAVVILIGVLGVVVVTMVRFRRRSDDEMPVQTHGNTPLELGWTIAPAILLAILGVPMMIVLFDIGREPKDDAFVVNVEGQRFSWVFEYPEVEDENGEPHVTIGELFVPVGREVAINLTSIDVIHSFAVPRIAGTRDAIPSIDADGDGTLDHVETMWIKVDEPRSYYADDDHSQYYDGQCRELCGAEHANMRIKMYAMDEADFSRWQEEVGQAASNEPVADEQVRAGNGD